VEGIGPSTFDCAKGSLWAESLGPSFDEGGVSLTGDVEESRSLEPDESFVRFFLRKLPRLGIGTET